MGGARAAVWWSGGRMFEPNRWMAMVGCWVALALVACLALDTHPQAASLPRAHVQALAAIPQAGERTSLREGMLRELSRRQYESARTSQLMQVHQGVQVKPAATKATNAGYSRWLKTMSKKSTSKAQSPRAKLRSKHRLTKLRRAKNPLDDKSWAAPMPPSFYGQLPCNHKTQTLACENDPAGQQLDAEVIEGK